MGVFVSVLLEEIEYWWKWVEMDKYTKQSNYLEKRLDLEKKKHKNTSLLEVSL